MPTFHRGHRAFSFDEGPGIVGSELEHLRAWLGVANRFPLYLLSAPEGDVEIELRIEELGPGGAPLQGDESWRPRLLLPDSTGRFQAHVEGPRRMRLGRQRLYQLAIEVSPPPGASRGRRLMVEGWLDGVPAGRAEWEVTLEHGAMPLPPEPRVAGGYCSTDLRLIDRDGHVLPVGAAGRRGEGALQPDTDYTLQAVVHNDSPTDAEGTLVRFWSMPGGLGTVGGRLLEARAVTVPAWGEAVVTCAVPFHSAPAGSHACAAVSIAHPACEGLPPDAFVSEQIPDPNADLTDSASAWRNSDARQVIAGAPFRIPLEASFDPQPQDLLAGRWRLLLDVDARQVPRDFERQPEVRALRSTLREAGAPRSRPLYLMSALRGLTREAALSIQLAAGSATDRGPGAPCAVEPAARASEPARLGFHLMAAGTARRAAFEVRGAVPSWALPGDQFFVTVTVHYPRSRYSRPKAVQFTQFLHVVAARPAPAPPPAPAGGAA